MQHSKDSEETERRPRILLAEDSYLVGEALRQMVHELQYDVCGPFATPEDAQRAIANEHLDAAVLDIELRGGTSISLAERLLDESVPVLFVTCYGSLMQLPPKLANVPRLVKPVLRAELQRAMRDLLEGC